LDREGETIVGSALFNGKGAAGAEANRTKDSQPSNESDFVLNENGTVTVNVGGLPLFTVPRSDPEFQEFRRIAIEQQGGELIIADEPADSALIMGSVAGSVVLAPKEITEKGLFVALKLLEISASFSDDTERLPPTPVEDPPIIVPNDRNIPVEEGPADP